MFFQKGSKLFDGGVPDHLKVLAFSQYIIFYNMHCLKFRDIFVLFIWMSFYQFVGMILVFVVRYDTLYCTLITYINLWLNIQHIGWIYIIDSNFDNDKNLMNKSTLGTKYWMWVIALSLSLHGDPILIVSEHTCIIFQSCMSKYDYFTTSIYSF